MSLCCSTGCAARAALAGGRTSLVGGGVSLLQTRTHQPGDEAERRRRLQKVAVHHIYRHGVAPEHLEYPAARRVPAALCLLGGRSVGQTTHLFAPLLTHRTARRFSTDSTDPRPYSGETFSVVDSSYDTTRVPDFSAYRRSRKTSPEDHRLATYAAAAAAGAAVAIGAKSTLINLLAPLAPSESTVAAGVIEVDLSTIPEGKNVVVKWRGKPVFVRHRTEEEVRSAEQVDVSELRDPQPDSDRVLNPRYLVMIGICTHLGCIPVGEAGDFGGWYCPCHGSHYDISGRIRQGPAPLNMEVPPYRFLSDTLIQIG